MTTADQDFRDFVDMLESQFPPQFAEYVRNHGGDPRSFIPAFETVSKTVNGWCVGRYGVPGEKG